MLDFDSTVMSLNQNGTPTRAQASTCLTGRNRQSPNCLQEKDSITRELFRAPGHYRK